MSNTFTFHHAQQLRDSSHTGDHAIQLGLAGGLWFRSDLEGLADNGGTVIVDQAGRVWQRTCEPGRLEARWFGVKADGVQDDAPAIQAAIDALPESGGKVLLPSGVMRCGSTLRISRSFITIEGVNCGLFSKYFEPGHVIGKGSLLQMDAGVNGVLIQGPSHEGEGRPARLGGVSLRDFGIAGTGRQAGQTGIIVKRGEGWGWGSTDGLLLERMYTIELEWSGFLQQCDMSIIDNCWFSECGNGLDLDGVIYNQFSKGCYADNDGYGLRLKGGKGNEFSSNVFVRNKVGLSVSESNTLRVTGGIFQTDGAGGERSDESLIYFDTVKTSLVTGANFDVKKQAINYAIILVGDCAGTKVESCVMSGGLRELIAEVEN